MMMKREIAEMAHDNWYLDSGASSHITNQIKDYAEFTPLNAGIRVGGNHYLSVEGIGTVKKELRTRHDRRTITLRGVRYSPELQCSLYSLRRQLNHSVPLCERVKVHIDESEYADVVLQSGTAKAHVDETKLYCLELESPRESAMVALSALPTQVSNLDLCHMRLGHLGKNALNALSSFDQWPLTHKNLRISENCNCETCVRGKLTRHSFKSRHPTSREYLVGEKVHVDPWGPYTQPSFGGKRYFVVFVDDASRFVTVYLLEHSSEVYEKFEAYYERVKTQLHVRMKGLRSDNPKEFQHLQNTCESKYGMEFGRSVKHTPEQNGAAERMIRTITEKMRCMLLHFDLPEPMWGEAALTATYIHKKSQYFAEFC
ncbi:unnamed protein product [Phytophthora fragariaefolia]|uniref:Unnamed protein product n=1 Tax=Phytophthora fragariaefolia TaxID=1490495 RepID=A0A9W6UBG2_9STRA|nr:unnamed protein product [Phytophthora fragariaefolia]